MNTLKSSSELKSYAKGTLLGKYGTVIPAFLAAESVIFLIQIIASNMVDMSTAYGMIIYYAIAFIVQLFAAIIALGQARLYLNITCNFPYAINDVYSGFSHHPDKAIKIQVLLLIYESLCMVPALIFYFLYTQSGNPLLMLATSITAIIGGISACVIALTYSQTNYLILDFPQYSATEIMKLSKKIMEGCKGSFFYLTVSFLPLILLSFVTCCIGYLWVIPYINATNAQFYLDLIRVKSAPVVDETPVASN